MKIKLDDYAYEPVRCHDTDAGMDLRSPFNLTLRSRSSLNIHTGVHVQLPHNTCGILISKSGLNCNHNITSTGLIDQSYRGEIVVKLHNHGYTDYQISAGDKISQLVVLPCMYESIEIVDELDDGERGSCGFGSTGR